MSVNLEMSSEGLVQFEVKTPSQSVNLFVDGVPISFLSVKSLKVEFISNDKTDKKLYEFDANGLPFFLNSIGFTSNFSIPFSLLGTVGFNQDNFVRVTLSFTEPGDIKGSSIVYKNVKVSNSTNRLLSVKTYGFTGSKEIDTANYDCLVIPNIQALDTFETTYPETDEKGNTKSVNVKHNSASLLPLSQSSTASFLTKKDQLVSVSTRRNHSILLFLMTL